jgi:hypothetical protein
MIESFDQESIFEYTLQLLTVVASSDIFNDFMKIKAVDIVEDSLDKERMDKDYNKIVFTKLITTHAFKYMGCCLVATKNPLEFVKTNFYPIVQKLKEKFSKIHSRTKLIIPFGLPKHYIFKSLK